MLHFYLVGATFGRFRAPRVFVVGVCGSSQHVEWLLSSACLVFVVLLVTLGYLRPLCVFGVCFFHVGREVILSTNQEICVVCSVTCRACEACAREKLPPV